MDIMDGNENILKDHDKNVVVKSLDESCVTLETRAWVSQDNYWDVKFTLLEQYKEAFDNAEIEIPYNQIDVHVKEK